MHRTCVIALSLLAAGSAHAGNEPPASSKDVIVAKVMSQACPGTLTTDGQSLLDRYLVQIETEAAEDDRARNGETRDGPVMVEFHRSFTATMRSLYARGERVCTADGAAEAVRVHEAVQRTLAREQRLKPPVGSPDRVPGLGEATTASVVAKRCAGTLTAKQSAELTYFIAREDRALLIRLSDADAEYTEQLSAKARRAIEGGFWSVWHCTAKAKSKAQDVAERATRANSRAEQ